MADWRPLFVWEAIPNVYVQHKKGVEIIENAAMQTQRKVRFVVVSDTHNKHNTLTMPDGDVLLHCGDMSDFGSTNELAEFNRWLGEQRQRYKHIVVIVGNHEEQIASLEPAEIASIFSNATAFLYDSSVVIEGIHIYGSPWVPNMGDQPGEPEIMKTVYDNNFFFRNPTVLRDKWALIPDDTNILMTHTPPRGILDARRYGCLPLRNRLGDLKRLRAHCFGHVHGARGCELAQVQAQGNTFLAINAACDPIVFDYHVDL